MQKTSGQLRLFMAACFICKISILLPKFSQASQSSGWSLVQDPHFTRDPLADLALGHFKIVSRL